MPYDIYYVHLTISYFMSKVLNRLRQFTNVVHATNNNCESLELLKKEILY